MESSMVKIIAGIVVVSIVWIVRKLTFKSKVSSLFRLRCKEVTFGGQKLDYWGSSTNSIHLNVDSSSNLEKSSQFIEIQFILGKGGELQIEWSESRIVFPDGKELGITGYRLDSSAPVLKIEEDTKTSLLIFFGQIGSDDVLSGQLVPINRMLEFEDSSKEIVINIKAKIGAGDEYQSLKVTMEANSVDAGSEVKYLPNEKVVNAMKTIREVS